MKKLTALLIALVMLLGMTGSVALADTVQDGVFSGTATGMGGEVKVDVTFEGGKIASIDTTHSETAGLGDVAIDKLVGEIIAHQSLNLDTVSGATISSDALLAATLQAIEAAGGALTDFSENITSGDGAPLENIEADIVIIGAGGAGMTAALSAVEAGDVSVVIVEKMAVSGGNTVRSTGGLNAAGTPEQSANEFAESAGVDKTLASAKDTYGEALADLIATVEGQWTAYQAAPEGYFDSAELFALDTLVGGKNVNDHALVNVLTTEAADAIRWLETIGAEMPSVGSFGGASVKRIHRPLNAEGKTMAVGSFLVPVLTERVTENDNITMLYETRATELLTSNNGAVSGVKVETAAGTYEIAADAVIIATGGFGANEEMYTKYQPNLAGFVTTNAPGATGDGILMAEAIGAATVDMAEIQIHPTVEQSTSALITEGLRGDGAILVNQEGKRFIDEVGTRDVVSAAIIAEPGSYAYLIVDQKMVDASSVIAGYITKGLTKQGDTLDALAAEIGTDAAALTDTLNTWNAAVASGSDAEFGRTSFANALDTAPYYAIQIAPGVHHTMGGLKINTDTQVINADGNPIVGLYAAGEVTGGVHGANRLGGNAVADIVVFGRIAGQNAVQNAAAADRAA